MTEWILSANPLIFDHERAFAERGYIDWKQTRNFIEEDTVYIYCSKPISAIRYKTIVEKANMTKDEISDNSDYWKGVDCGDEGNRYMRLRLIAEISVNILPFAYLKNIGLKYAPQSPCVVKDGLKQYLDAAFGGK